MGGCASTGGGRCAVPKGEARGGAHSEGGKEGIAGGLPVVAAAPSPEDTSDEACKAPAAGQPGEKLVVIRVVKARLYRNFDSFGRMDPFAVVEFSSAAGANVEVSETRTDWNGHMAPQWDHTCRGLHYSGAGSGNEVAFKVFEAAVVGKPTFCGSARITVDDLLGADAMRSASSTSSFSKASNTKMAVCGPVHELNLKNAGEDVGKITIQALVARKPHSHSVLGKNGEVLTYVDSEMFETPVSRMRVSGGTAPFFTLLLRKPKSGQSREYYIGKDLSHATDEITFYEEAIRLMREHGCGGLGHLLRFTLEYAGVATCAEEGRDPSRGGTSDLLVMRNLRDGHKTLRMLDIKIGQQTAHAGWRGKSRMAALKQGLIDGHTNSSCEGFRLEGFDGRPPALNSLDPFMDFGIKGSEKLKKKALRVMLQRMSGAEMLMHFLDVHQEPQDLDDVALQQFRGPSEVAELVLHEIVHQLAVLAILCRQSHVPQKWVGSSVALGFDCGSLPPRSIGEAQFRQGVQVRLFDWGRSELNTLDKHLNLSKAEQHDRAKFWGYYVGGIDRLSWEAARAYRHRFCCADSWTRVKFTVYDFDSLSNNDFLGTVIVPVEETAEKTVDMRSAKGHKVSVDCGLRGVPRITYSIQWRPFPEGSRLRGAWRVKIVKAERLARMDKAQLRSTSDPLCQVTALADGLRFRQVSNTIQRSLDPEWGETFELPIARDPEGLRTALRSAFEGIGDGHEPLSRLFPPEATADSSDGLSRHLSDGINHLGFGKGTALEEWQSCLNKAAQDRARQPFGDWKSTYSASEPMGGESQLLPFADEEMQSPRTPICGWCCAADFRTVKAA